MDRIWSGREWPQQYGHIAAPANGVRKHMFGISNRRAPVFVCSRCREVSSSAVGGCGWNLTENFKHSDILGLSVPLITDCNAHSELPANTTRQRRSTSIYFDFARNSIKRSNGCLLPFHTVGDNSISRACNKIIPFNAQQRLDDEGGRGRDHLGFGCLVVLPVECTIHVQA